MRGSPLFRALLALGILLALGWPLHRMLRVNANAAVVPLPTSPSVAQGVVKLRMSFTSPPTRMEIKYLGEPVWKVAGLSTTAARDLTLPYPKEGIELEFALAWPAGAPAAAKVQFTDPQGEEYVRYLWGEGETSEVLSFP